MKQNTRILCGAMAAAMTVSLAGCQGGPRAVRWAAAANPRTMTRRRLREPVYQR